MMKRPYPQAVRVGVPRGIELSLFILRWREKVLVLCFSHITFRLISLSRSSPGSGLAYPRNLFVATILAALSLGAYGGGSRRCSCRTVVDVRLILDRAARRR